MRRIRSDQDFDSRTIRTNPIETDPDKVNQQEMYLEAIAAERKRIEANPHYNMHIGSQKFLAQKIVEDPNASERDKKFVRDFFPELLR